MHFLKVSVLKVLRILSIFQRQHRQLHTHEQVLRYQLSQKRRMLNELKEELEYCRRKWNLAREKNDESQIQWDTLRREFTARKLQDSGSQNSAESGFSDDPVSDDDGSELPTSTIVTEKQYEVPVIIAQPVLLQEAITLDKNSEASGSGIGKLQLSAELRKKKTKKVKTKTNAETLEDMFYRISGLEPPEESSSDESEEEEELFEEPELISLLVIPEEVISITEEEATQSSTPEPEIEALSDFVDPEDEERRQRRAERFQRLEEQCAQLIKQVNKTATRGNELNKQLDDVHNRYRTPTREAHSAGSSTTVSFDEGASTSSNVPPDTNTNCLTEKEQEFVSRRAARLKRLEDECKAFLNKVSATNEKGTDLCTKLDALHEHHSARLTERKSISKESSTDQASATDTNNDDVKETDSTPNHTDKKIQSQNEDDIESESNDLSSTQDINVANACLMEATVDSATSDITIGTDNQLNTEEIQTPQVVSSTDLSGIESNQPDQPEPDLNHVSLNPENHQPSSTQ